MIAVRIRIVIFEHTTRDKRPGEEARGFHGANIESRMEALALLAERGLKEINVAKEEIVVYAPGNFPVDGVKDLNKLRSFTETYYTIETF